MRAHFLLGELFSVGVDILEDVWNNAKGFPVCVCVLCAPPDSDSGVRLFGLMFYKTNTWYGPTYLVNSDEESTLCLDLTGLGPSWVVLKIPHCYFFIFFITAHLQLS